MTVSVDDLSRAAIACTLDLRGQTCPTTSDETLRALEGMATGAVLEVISDYYPARSTIPFHCEKRGYRYAFMDANPEGWGGDTRATWRLRVQKS